MKIRDPRLIRIASWAGAGLLRGWMRTLRVRADSRGQHTRPGHTISREAAARLTPQALTQFSPLALLSVAGDRSTHTSSRAQSQ